jgi:hypothetical protein
MAAFGLDLLFVWADVGGPEAERLVAFGLTEAAPKIHPGHGTACRRFLFSNADLEPVWVQDDEEVRGEPGGPIRIWALWAGRRTGASPLRPGSAASGPPVVASLFPHGSTGLLISRPPRRPRRAEHAGFGALLVPSGLRPAPRRPGSANPPADWARDRIRPAHGRSARGSGPGNPTQAGRVVPRLAKVAPGDSSEHLAGVTFDEGRRGRVENFRPVLPLLFRC